MAVTASYAYSKQFDRNILRMFLNEYAARDPEYTKIAKIKDAPAGKTYTEAEISGLGPAQEVPEGSAVPFDLPVEGNQVSRPFTQYGLGYQLTLIAREDDVHGKLEKVAKTLAIAMNTKIEMEFFKLFNLGNTNQYAWDGKPIFANNHTTLKSGTTISNVTSAALSETALQAAFEYFDNLVDEAGNPIADLKLDLLVVPSQLRWVAMRLAKQEGGITSTAANSPDLSGNDMTTNPANGYVGAWKIHVSRYLNDPDNWFALSSAHEMTLMWKRRVILESGEDFKTANRLYRVWARFGAFCNPYKPVYGAFPA